MNPILHSLIHALTHLLSEWANFYMENTDIFSKVKNKDLIPFLLQDAGGFSIGQSEAGYQDEAAPDGAFLCQRDVVWI